MRVFCLLYKYASHSKEKWERCDHKCVLVCQILLVSFVFKQEFSRHIVEKYSNIK